MLPRIAFATILLAAAEAQSPPTLPLYPTAPKIDGCKWANNTMNVWWTPPAGAEADYYEVQISSDPMARAFAVTNTFIPFVQLGFDTLLPGTTYYFSIRPHAKWTSQVGYSWGRYTWAHTGPSHSCTTPMALKGSKQLQDVIDVTGDDIMTLESVRISEGTSGVDYLMNHDGGDMAGDVMLVTAVGQYEELHGEGTLSGSWMGEAMEDIALTTYCVDALKSPTKGTRTTRDHEGFSDYQSCNIGPNPAAPLCQCAFPSDRNWGRLDVLNDKQCRKTILGVRSDQPCSPPTGSDMDWPNCECKCDPADLDRSGNYTGIVDMFAYDEEKPIGVWYHHPWGTMCYPGYPLGSKTPFPPNNACTWKPRPLARVIHGWQLYAAGFNVSKNPDCEPAVQTANRPCSPHADQIRQNVEVVRKLLKAQPLSPWSCRKVGENIVLQGQQSSESKRTAKDLIALIPRGCFVLGNPRVARVSILFVVAVCSVLSNCMLV